MNAAAYSIGLEARGALVGNGLPPGYIAEPLSPLALFAGPPGSSAPPIAIPGMRQSSPVGWRIGGRHSTGEPQTWHAGIDLRAAEGTPIYAVRNGRVILSVPDGSPGFGGYGQTIVIYHPAEELTSAYAHLSARYVEAGDRVVPGQEIGATGRTSSGSFPDMAAHLHFELRARIPEGSSVRGRTVRAGGETLLTRSPWPGPYSEPNREPERFAVVWRNPLEWLAGLGIQGPPLPYGEAGRRFSIVAGSSADARGGMTSPIPPTSRTAASVEPAPSVFEGLPLDFSPLALEPARSVAGGGVALAGVAVAAGVVIAVGKGRSSRR